MARSRRERGEVVGLDGEGLAVTPYYDEDGVTIYHGDCREILPYLAGDLVFADPPYGVSLKYEGHDDSELLGMEWLHTCRLLAPTIVTPGYVNIYDYPRPDYNAIRYDRSAQSPAGIAYMNKWEPILFYGKFSGRLPWDVIETSTNNYGRQKDEARDHPCPKTITLMRALLGPLAEVGDIVIDPFLGSGTTAKACRELGLRCIGIEIEERYCEIAVKRLAQGVLSFD